MANVLNCHKTKLFNHRFLTQKKNKKSKVDSLFQHITLSPPKMPIVLCAVYFVVMLLPTEETNTLIFINTKWFSFTLLLVYHHFLYCFKCSWKTCFFQSTCTIFLFDPQPPLLFLLVKILISCWTNGVEYKGCNHIIRTQWCPP